MAKTQKGTRRQAAERADQLRSAVEDALQSAGSQLSRERAQEIADELGSAVERMRDAFDQLRPPTADDLRRLVDRLTALERRVAALEIPGRPAPAKKVAPRKAAKKPAAKKPAASKAAKKPAARKPAKKPAARG